MFTSQSRLIDIFRAMSADEQETIVTELIDAAKYYARMNVITNLTRKNLRYILSELTTTELTEVGAAVMNTGFISKINDFSLISELESRGYEISKPSEQ